jgi:hypothetical protein
MTTDPKSELTVLNGDEKVSNDPSPQPVVNTEATVTKSVEMTGKGSAEAIAESTEVAKSDTITTGDAHKSEAKGTSTPNEEEKSRTKSELIVVTENTDMQYVDAPEAGTEEIGADGTNNEGKDTEMEVKSSTPKDPYVGKIVERNKVLQSGHLYPLQGQVIGYREPSGRIPPRWNVQYETTEKDVIMEEEWLQTDLQPDGDATIYQKKAPLVIVQERYQQHLDHVLESNSLVSTLLLYAALEEALQTTLQHQNMDTTTSSSSKKGGWRGHSHPPLYYSSNPSSYLQPPTATDTTPSLSATSIQLTPAALAQRVRSGSEWAWNFLSAQQPLAHPPPTLSNDRVQRRSLRQPKPIITENSIPYPNPVQRGGRVAMWWLKEMADQANPPIPKVEKLEEEKQTEEIEKQSSPEQEFETEEDKKSKGKDLSGKSNYEGEKNTAMEVESVPETESTKSQDGDDGDEDFSAKDVEENEEDEELEGVEKERLQLSPVPSLNTASAKEEEEESDDENDIMFENPFLVPSFPAFLEYIARPRALSGEDVQRALCESILRVRHNKRSAEHGLQTDLLEPVDEFVMDQETPNFPTGKVVLKCVSGETYAELKNLDPQTFARCKFVLDVVGDQEGSLQVQRKEELLQQEFEFKERKAWDKWRFRGIHEGYTKWPSWDEYISEWVKTNCAPAIATAVALSEEIEKSDQALAKTLEEAASTGRRSTRRAANPGSEGVFYGNQSQLTHKQLMDALIRLVKANQYRTLLGLQVMVADDSSDPLRRIRVALGKLVWKGNHLSRKQVSTELSDSKLIKNLKENKPLFSIKMLSEDEEEGDLATEAESKPLPLSEEEQGLVKYIQELHSTELHLRNLILRNLAEIPLAIVATAADERMNSMESMDAADFEDQSSIEWYSSGHDLVDKLIFRPEHLVGTTDMTECQWWRIKDYSKSVNSEAEEAADDPLIVERRMRFRAFPSAPPGESYQYEESDPLILTEAQVHAGLKAAELEVERKSEKASSGNPFAGGSGDKISLVPVDTDEKLGTIADEIHCRIVGHNNVVNESDGSVEYRILVLPEPTGKGQGKAFWATLDTRSDDASYVCQPLGKSSTWYSIEHFDYHQGSEAQRECQNVLKYLHRQSKIAAFLEPVDPVALGIPLYFEVVKNPMDVSTVSDKLENGLYSSIPPGQAIGLSPISRMLNGPFRKDVELIFDNAMLFNPPDDWIHQAASQVKKNALKKIADLSYAADQKHIGSGRLRQRRSVYMDDDSDMDLYEYESDQDDEFDGGRRSKKRKRNRRAGAKEEYHARAIENVIRLQLTLRDATDLRGPFANLSINMDASSFTVSPEWSCRHCTEEKVEEAIIDSATQKRSQEITKLLALQKEVSANEAAGLRRSTRASNEPSKKSGAKGFIAEFFTNSSQFGSTEDDSVPNSRLEVEVYKEKRHEEYYSKIYQKYAKMISSTDGNSFGMYEGASFPPYLGRIVPIADDSTEVSWEIRDSFVVPALRWILRGLIASGHLTELEPMVANTSQGILITNDVYFNDGKLQPFEILDLKELQKRKRANRESNDSESDEDIELSEYEKLRAQRVARNAERLKALGLT